MDNIQEYMTQIQYFLEQARGGNIFKSDDEKVKERLKSTIVTDELKNIYTQTLTFFKQELLKELLAQSMEDQSILQEYLSKKEKSLTNLSAGTRSKHKLAKIKKELESTAELKSKDFETIHKMFSEHIKLSETSSNDMIDNLIRNFSSRLNSKHGYGLNMYSSQNSVISLKNPDGTINEEYIDIIFRLIDEPSLLITMKKGHNLSQVKQFIKNMEGITELGNLEDLEARKMQHRKYYNELGYIYTSYKEYSSMRSLFQEKSQAPGIIREYMECFEKGNWKKLDEIVKEPIFEDAKIQIENRKNEILTMLTEQITEVNKSLPENISCELYPDFEALDYYKDRQATAYGIAVDKAVLNSIRIINQYNKNKGKKLNPEELVELGYVDENVDKIIQSTVQDFAESNINKR